MRKKLNPIALFIDRNMRFGSFVNFNTPDAPGGMVSDGGGDPSDDKMGGGADDSPGTGDSGDDSGDDGKVADGDGGDDDGKVADGDGDDDGKGDDKGDVNARFSSINNKIDSLLNAINQASNSDDDGDGDDLNLEHEDLVAMLAEDPENFIGKLTGIIEANVSKTVAEDIAAKTYNDNVERVINEYADSDETFEQMWDDGSIKDFMSKNPGHNAISAHMTLTMEAKLEEARKQGAEEAIKNYRTKANNQVLSGSHGITPDNRDAALKDPKKYGGRAAVIAARAGIQ